MINYLRKVSFISNKAKWLGWFVTVHIVLSMAIMILMIATGINPTLFVSVLGAPLWIGVAFASKYITDKIMED